MTVLSTFTHEREQAGDPKSGAPGALNHAQVDHETWRVDASIRSVADELPPVLLQLPDLADAEPDVAIRPARVADQVFWVALVLGALLALTLIWTGEKPPVQPVEEAPTWQGEQNGIQLPTSEFAPREQVESSWPGIGLPRPTDLDSLEPSAEEPGMPADSADPSSMETPSDAEFGSPQIHTARAGQSTWDGTAPAMNPGEAAPVGTIHSTPVQP